MPSDRLPKWNEPIGDQTPTSRHSGAPYADKCCERFDQFTLNAPDRRAQLERLDSAALGYATQGTHLIWANFTIARLKEAQGDRAGALRAIRRLQNPVLNAQYHSAILRERARLALAAGDTSAAIKDYTHYLNLHTRAEASVQPAVARVRAQLQQLVPERAR